MLLLIKILTYMQYINPLIVPFENPVFKNKIRDTVPFSFSCHSYLIISFSAISTFEMSGMDLMTIS